jgi:hypothetical protein
MKRTLLILLIAVAMIGVVAAVPGNGLGLAFGKDKDSMRYQEGNHPNNGLHLGQDKECPICPPVEEYKNLVLIGKDSSDWSYAPENGFGILKYKDAEDNEIGEFGFKGYGLVAGEDYSLISYAEPWPGTGLVILGSDVADNLHGTGFVQISGSSGSLVCNDYDVASPDTPQDYTGTGSKIWLVPTDDLTSGAFNGWNPNSYLFETELINVGCTP